MDVRKFMADAAIELYSKFYNPSADTEFNREIAGKCASAAETLATALHFKWRDMRDTNPEIGRGDFFTDFMNGSVIDRLKKKEEEKENPIKEDLPF